jgi:hypothetical protein
VGEGVSAQIKEAIQVAIINGYRGFLKECDTPQPNQALMEIAIKNSIVIREVDNGR